MKMLSQIISRKNFSNTLTRNLFTGALMLLLTAGMVLTTSQDAHAQSVTVNFSEPTGTQTTKTFKVGVTLNLVASAGPGGNGTFTTGDVSVTTTRTQGSGDATVVAVTGSGKIYDVEIKPPGNAKGSITFTVKQNSISATHTSLGWVHGPSSAKTTNSISFDTTNLLTVDFTEPTGVQTSSTFTVPIAFSHTVTGFTASDITVATTRTSGSGDATVSLSGSGSSYTATVTPPTNAIGGVTLTVKKDSVTFNTNLNGPSTAETSKSIGFDTMPPPTVSFTEPAGTQAGTTFTVPITISKSVTGFAASDITVTTTRTSGTGNATVALSGSGTSYTATVTSPTAAKGTITLEVAKDAVTDGSNRTGPTSAATSSAISFDTTVPTVSFSLPTTTQTGATFGGSITFSKSVTGFDQNDLTITTTHTSGTGDATFTLSGSGKTYTVTVTLPSAAKGTVTLEVAKDAVTDGTRTGPSSKATSSAVNFDTTAPTVAFTEPADTQAGTTFDVPITFSKSVTGFSTADITITTTRTSGTGNATFTLSGSGEDYTATVTSPTAAKGTITLEIRKNAAIGAGKRSGPVNKVTSDAISFDTTVPTVTYTEPAGTQAAATFDVPITISKSVTGFAASDITVTTTRTSGTGDATVALSGSGTSYTATVTSPTAAKGTITLEVAADSVTDGTRTGPASKATSSAINFDTTVPTVSFTEPAGTQIADTFDVPITISKSVTGFAASDITVTSSTGTASVSLSGSGTSYTATVTSPTAAKGTVTLEVAADSVTDGTRTGPASKATSSAINFDTTVATVSFTEPAGTQIADTFDVPITISKSVTGLAASDITITTTRTSGTGDATVSLSGSGSSYTATVTSPTAAKGTITLEVAKNAVTDGTRTGPASKATSSAISFDTSTITVDFTEPTGTQIAPLGTFRVPITFSKNVTASDPKSDTGSFKTTNFSVTTTLTSGTGSASVQSVIGNPGGTGYDIDISLPSAAKGTVTLTVNANVATDGTRKGPASDTTSDAMSFDTTVPTADFTEPAGTQYGNTFNVPITFSKVVSGFAASDITVTTTRTSGTGDATVALSGSDSSYTAAVTLPTTAKGTVTLTIAKNSVTDGKIQKDYGVRKGPASDTTSDAISFDTTVPTVTYTEPAGTQYANTFTVPITFSKSVTGFTTVPNLTGNADLTVKTTRTSGTGNATVSLSGSGASYTATITSPTAAKGTITLEIAADSVTDGTRTGPASKATSSAISFDTTVTTVSFNEPAGTQYGNTFDVPITFSKSVTGFTASDLTLTSSTGTASVSLSGSGTSYTATVTSPTAAKGTITLEVAKDAVTDGTRTGPASKATSSAISFDTTVATVSFTEPAGTQVSDTFDVPITFSKSVTGFAASDITVTSSTGTASVSLSGSGTSYTATVTSPTAAKGTITLEVAADSVTDGTRTGPASKATSSAISFDTTVATVSFNEPNGVQTSNNFDVGIDFSKSVTGFTASDITLVTTLTSGSGTPSVSLSGSGSAYTATITSLTTAKGTIVLEVAKDAVTDGTRTAPASKAVSAAIAFDTTVPTVTFSEPKGTQTADTFTVGINFSKSVTGFEAGDLTLTTTKTGTPPTVDATRESGDLTLTTPPPQGFGDASFTLSGSGSSYTATVTSPTEAKGTVKFEIAKDAATDGTKQVPKNRQTSKNIAFDTTTPQVTYDEPQGVQIADTFDVGILFSKSVTGFEAGDIRLTTTHKVGTSGTGNASLTLKGSGESWIARITPPKASKGTVRLTIGAYTVTDGTRTGPNSELIGSAIAFDTTVATVSFSEPTGVQTVGVFDVPITFSKSVTGFNTVQDSLNNRTGVVADLTVTIVSENGSGGATVKLRGSGSAYVAAIIPPTAAKGTITLQVVRGAATDGTRPAPASKTTSKAIAFDTTVATVSFNEPTGTQYGSTFNVGITFSKGVTGFEASDITVKSSSGTASLTLSGSGTDYTARVTSPTNAKGTLTLQIAANSVTDVTDGARRAPASNANSKVIAFDTTQGTVSFSEPAGTQRADTFNVGITFSKSVTGFETGDITLTTTHTNGSGNATFTLSGSGTSYTATVTSPTAAQGTVTLAVGKHTANDGANSVPATTETSQAIAFDTTLPAVSFTEPQGVQTGAFNVVITFSKSVTGFEVGDLTLTTTRTSGTGTAALSSLTGSGTNYAALIIPPANAAGSIDLTVKADAATDGVRNGPSQNASVSVSFDTQVNTPPVNLDPINAPPATLVFSEPSGTQRADTFDVGITFSKSVTGFEASDITVVSTSGTASLVLSGSGTSWTATITSPTDAAGSVTLEVAADAANDGVQDVPTTAQTSASVAFDTTVPSVSFTAPQGVQSSAFDVGITFSKSVTGFEVGDLTLTTTRTHGIGDATIALAGSGADYTATITLPVDAAGGISLTVKADAASDGVRNGPSENASVSVSFDTQVSTPPVDTPPANTPPVDTPPANTPPVNTDPTNTPPLNTNPTTLVFSEPSGTQLNNTFDVGITFSKPVTGFETDDITLITTRADTSGGTVSSVLTGEGANYTTTITVPAEAKGTLQVQVRADAANDGVYDMPTAVRTSESIAFDTTVPTVRFTVPQDVQTGPFDVDITFSKPVNRFELGDMTLTTTRMYGIDDATFTLTGSGTDYTVTITPPVDTAGEIVLTVKVNAGTDGVRNGPAADVSITIDFETESQLVDTGSTEEYGSDFGKVIFNEIYNGTEDKNDWIELKNVGQRSVNLGDWEIGIVTGNGKTLEEKKIITLPSYELLPNHILLILNSATEKTAIAAGIDIYTGRWDDAVLESWNVSRYLVTKKLKLPLPVEEKYLLTLREKKDRIGTSEAIVDVASTYWPNNLDHETLLWPLYIQKPTGIRPVFALDAAWRRTDKKIPGTTATKKLPGYLAAAWTASGYQEGRGYDKDAPKATSLGTPGHLNDYPVATNLPSGPVSISELMFATRDFGRAAPQWIEFYNTSNKTVDLRGWQFNLEVKPEPNTLRNTTWGFTFEGVHIGPKQTLLIVTQRGSNSGHFPEHKVYDVSVQHADMPGVSELLDVNRYSLLSSAGFSLMLSDANGKMVDKIGNLDGDSKTMDKPAWKLPAGRTLEGYRNSLIRKYENGEPLPGTEQSSWQVAKDLKLSFRTYWGHSTDIGNPGYRQGGYLPVSLSHFDALFTGTEVVLKWTTESELDNAGFNIYRSETRTGAFKQINAELIRGAGTTGERQQYEWKDTTAKPNVSYYYRIEDVSFSGVREQLQTVRMRGHVSASGKELRTWASIKSDR